MKQVFNISQKLLEKNLLPDFITRAGGRELLRKKLLEESKGGPEAAERRKRDLVEFLKKSPIAVAVNEANEQHYEVPTEFFKFVLGKHMKYSSGLWNEGVLDIDKSELDMLTLTVERAELKNGHKILELGCGWGSLTLFMAEKFPESRITAVSNSRTQKQYIENEARLRGFKNLEVITADMRDFETSDRFDRVVSVEMFEHMRNYEKLFEKIARFMTPEAKLFSHIFSHKKYAYLYDEKDEFDWIAKYFFTGGTMPSHDLFSFFSKDLIIEKDWKVSGLHYQKTSEAWLKRMDANRAKIWPIFIGTYGADECMKWWAYWRTFFIACSELFGYSKGEEWGVSHYLFKKS